MENYAKMSLPCEEIGRALACSDDISQAAVLNSLAKELRVVCQDSDLQGTQICYFAKGLDSNGRLLVESLAEYIRLWKEAKPVETPNP